MPQPFRPVVDRNLDNLGQDIYHDDIHDIIDDDAAGGDDAASDSSKASDNRDSDDEPSADDVAAVAGDDVPSVDIVAIECSPGQADAAHRAHSTIAALHETIDVLRTIGSVEGVQSIQHVLAKERRKARNLASDSPAVADAFLRLRKADDDVMRKRIRRIDQIKQT